MEYIFKFNTDDYNDAETLLSMLESIINLLSAPSPDVTDLALSLKKQFETQLHNISVKTHDRTVMMKLFNDCVKKYTNYNSLYDMCKDVPEFGTKAYDNIFANIGEAMGTFAYTIHKFHPAPWMYQLIDIYENNWDWEV